MMKKAVRSMLAQIIEDEDLGEVIGEAEDGLSLEQQMVILKKYRHFIYRFVNAESRWNKKQFVK